MYAVEHYNGKGRVADFLTAQDNAIDDPNGTMWTVFTNGPYLDMLVIQSNSVPNLTIGICLTHVL